jgi:hypothetical protein
MDVVFMTDNVGGQEDSSHPLAIVERNFENHCPKQHQIVHKEKEAQPSPRPLSYSLSL